eukprot:scaffold10049_cov70-Attheya_sp.AAC.1
MWIISGVGDKEELLLRKGEIGFASIMVFLHGVDLSWRSPGVHLQLAFRARGSMSGHDAAGLVSSVYICEGFVLFYWGEFIALLSV